MRYLVTGGAGFIGSHLVEKLVAHGQDIVVLDDFSTGRRENLAPFSDRIRLVEGSITDASVCLSAMEGVDYVLHQAALGSVPRSVAFPGPTHEVNATGTLNLLQAARQHRVRRFIYAASSSAYGNTAELPKREEMLSRPLSPYAVAKMCGEMYLHAFWNTYQLETIALRYFNVFGPRQDPKSQYAAVIPLFIDAALDGRQPTIFGDGNQTRDFTFVENVVNANLCACRAPTSAAGQVFNVGAGQRTSLNDLWEQIALLAGVAIAPAYEPARAGDVRDSLAALEKAKKFIDFEPTVGVAEGLRRTIAYTVARRHGLAQHA